MSYSRINWLRRIRQFANRIKLTLVSGTTYDVEQIEGTVTQIGVPFTDTDMNKMDFALYLSHNTFTLTSAGTDAYTSTITGLTSLNELQGIPIKILANFANAGAATINFNGLGAKPLTRNVSEDLVTGDVLNNSIVTIVYDGLRYQVVGLMSDTTKLSLTGGRLTGLVGLDGGSEAKNRGAGAVKVMRDVKTFFGATNQIGSIKIKLPVSWPDTMMTIKITGYNYSNGVSARNGWELIIGCYASGGSWAASSPTIVGDAPFSKVSLGYDTGASLPCILLGDISTTWDYATINISEVLTAWAGWDLPLGGWDISVISALTGITGIITPVLKGAQALSATLASNWNVGTTSTEIPGFRLPIIAGKKYKVKCVLASSNGSNYAVTANIGTSGGNGVIATHLVVNATGTVPRAGSGPSPAQTIADGIAGVIYYAHFDGVFDCTASGDLIVVANAVSVGTATIYSDRSYFELTRIN